MAKTGAHDLILLNLIKKKYLTKSIFLKSSKFSVWTKRNSEDARSVHDILFSTKKKTLINKLKSFVVFLI